MIYYYIQTDNATDMAHYIDLAMDVAITANNNESIGILLRLKGLYHLMIGDLDQAESYIQESITILILPTVLTKSITAILLPRMII